MKTKSATFKLPIDLLLELDEMSEGNKTALLIGLLNQAIAMRNVDKAVREIMYVSAKNSTADTKLLEHHSDVRNLIDGLYL